MNIDSRLAEIEAKIKELDSLIDNTLDQEPEESYGEYGTKIQELFNDTKWIDIVISL